MAGNIGMELNLAADKINRVLSNFIPPKLTPYKSLNKVLATTNTGRWRHGFAYKCKNKKQKCRMK